jgi:GT2 family glycosyltransferase
MNKRKVSVVVLNWNGWSDSLKCLRSLQPAVKQGLARIIIVDNASTDDSVIKIREWLHSRHSCFVELTEIEIPSVPIRPQDTALGYAFIRSRRNGGYAAGNNLGIRFALRLVDTEYVFVLNNDTTVEPNSISRLVTCADEDPEAGVVGSTLIEGLGSLRIAGGCKYNLLLTRAIPVLATGDACEAAMDYVSGAALFIRAAALRQVGLLCEDYFLYFEELDFTRRLTTAGFKITWCPGSVVHHTVGRAAGSRSRLRGKKSLIAEYHSNLSCLIFLRKFHPRLFWLAAPTRFLLKLLHNSIHMQPDLITPLVRAYRDCFVRMARKTT